MSDDLFLGIVIGLSCFLYALVLYVTERKRRVSTRAQVDAMIPVFLAALREAGYPVADSYAWAKEYPTGGWRFVFYWDDDIPDEVAHRAITLARASIGLSAPCWWCWTHHKPNRGPNPCGLGDCRAPIKETT